MVGWHHRFNGYEFEQALGVGSGQGGLECCSPWGHRVGHDWVYWTEECEGRELWGTPISTGIIRLWSDFSKLICKARSKSHQQLKRGFQSILFMVVWDEFRGTMCGQCHNQRVPSSSSLFDYILCMIFLKICLPKNTLCVHMRLRVGRKGFHLSSGCGWWGGC